MTMLFSASARAFFDTKLHEQIPADAIEVSAEEYAELFSAQATGARIEAGEDGQPVAVTPALPSEDDLRRQLAADIDTTADAVRTTLVGDPLRVVEYQRAADEAVAFKAAGYAGEMPQTVKSWAEAKDWSGQQAADDILATAAQWNAALYLVRDVRLKAKEGVARAPDLDSARTIAEAAIVQLTSALQPPAPPEGPEPEPECPPAEDPPAEPVAE